MTVSKTTGVGITNMQAMQAAPGAPSPQSLDITVEGGGKAGIWMSGQPPAVDEATNRVFVVTGYAQGPWLTHCEFQRQADTFLQQRKRRAWRE